MDDEQIGALLSSPLYLQEREANADRSQVYHPGRENLMSGSSQDPKSTGRPVALYSSKNWSNQETFSDGEYFSSGHHQVLGNNKPLFRFSHPENTVKLLLEGHRDHLPAEAKSEECKVDSLNICILELQRQAHSHRFVVDSASCGYESKPDYTKNWRCERSTSRNSYPK